MDTVRGWWLGGVDISGGSVERGKEKIVGIAGVMRGGGYAAYQEEGWGWEWGELG